MSAISGEVQTKDGNIYNNFWYKDLFKSGRLNEFLDKLCVPNYHQLSIITIIITMKQQGLLSCRYDIIKDYLISWILKIAFPALPSAASSSPQTARHCPLYPLSG